jgi:hypothetical protein
VADQCRTGMCSSLINHGIDDNYQYDNDDEEEDEDVSYDEMSPFTVSASERNKTVTKIRMTKTLQIFFFK